MNQDTCMKVAVYAVIAIIVILVVRYYLNQEHFANEHKHHEHKHHEHKHHEHKHEHKHQEQEAKPVNAPLALGDYTLNPDTDGWLRIKNKDKSQYANLASKDMWVDGMLHVNSGSVELNNNRLYFDAPNNNSSDPYYIQKVVTSPNNSSLRLTINDDADESFQIWGNSCGEAGGCGGDGAMKHKFIANGDAIHNGALYVNSGKIDFQVDTRNVNSSPDQYLSRGVGQYREFKNSSIVGLNDNYFVVLDTIVPWPDYSGGHIKQIAYGDKNVYFRSGTGGSFGGWNVMGNSV